MFTDLILTADELVPDTDLMRLQNRKSLWGAVDYLQDRAMARLQGGKPLEAEPLQVAALELRQALAAQGLRRLGQDAEEADAEDTDAG